MRYYIGAFDSSIYFFFLKDSKKKLEVVHP